MTACTTPLRLALLALLSIAGLTRCTKSEVTDATEVIVVVDSDKELKSQLATIQVDVLDKDAQDVASSYEFKLDAKTALPMSFGVFQPEGGADVFRLHTRGLDAEGALLVEDKVIERFEQGKRRVLKVTLSSACKGSFCSQAELTCNPRTGACEDVPRPSGVSVQPSESEAGVETEEEGGVAADGGSEGGAQDAGDGGGEITPPVPPSLAGAATFGGRRSDGTITVYDDGFEQGQRLCTADGKFCVTGGFSP